MSHTSNDWGDMRTSPWAERLTENHLHETLIERGWLPEIVDRFGPRAILESLSIPAVVPDAPRRS
jgi:hypothetical protein